jgi:DNA polymerase III subunit epsilon
VYAVIDLETTGLNPNRHDRIVEIAIIHVDDAGDITSEWSTLINPHRDMGPQHIHVVSAADARRAPTFAQAAPHIAGLLAGRVVVAHNLAFDAPFLAHQFRQLGVEVPLGIDEGLCTMMMAATYLPAAGRSLAACCAAASIPLENAHCALDDTRAAAMLLGRYIRTAGSPVPWLDLVQLSADRLWPSLPEAAPAFTPAGRRAAGTARPSFLGRLVQALPRVVTPPESDRYLAVLDRALVDRQISETEADALVGLARRLGLGRDDVLRLHADYLTALGAAALADGVVARAEVQELESVAALLGLPKSAVASSLQAAAVQAAGPAAVVPAPRQAARRFALSPGDIVVFTGQTREPREALEVRARDAGLRIAEHVTRDTALIVAADVDTMSGKAHAGRDYGVPIVSVETFVGFLTPPVPADMQPAGD